MAKDNKFQILFFKLTLALMLPLLFCHYYHRPGLDSPTLQQHSPLSVTKATFFSSAVVRLGALGFPVQVIVWYGEHSPIVTLQVAHFIFLILSIGALVGGRVSAGNGHS